MAARSLKGAPTSHGSIDRVLSSLSERRANRRTALVVQRFDPVYTQEFDADGGVTVRYSARVLDAYHAVQGLRNICNNTYPACQNTCDGSAG